MAALSPITQIDPAVLASIEAHLDRTDPEGESAGRVEKAQSNRPEVEERLAHRGRGVRPPVADEKPAESQSSLAAADEDEREEEVTEEVAPEEEAVEASEAEEAASDADDPDAFIETLDQLAESYEVEPDVLLELQVRGRDETDSPTLARVLDYYRSGAGDEATVRAEIDRVTEGLTVESDARLNELMTLVTRLSKRVNTGMPSQAAMEVMKIENPQRYIELNERNSDDIAAGTEALASMNAEVERRQAADRSRQASWESEQQVVLFKRMPEWRDPKVAAEAQKVMSRYLAKMPFAKERIANLKDALEIETVYKAALFDQAATAGERARKKLRRLPRRHLGQTPRDEAAPRAAANKRRTAQVNRFRKSGKIDDAVELFGEHL